MSTNELRCPMRTFNFDTYFIALLCLINRYIVDLYRSQCANHQTLLKMLIFVLKFQRTFAGTQMGEPTLS